MDLCDSHACGDCTTFICRRSQEQATTRNPDEAESTSSESAVEGRETDAECPFEATKESPNESTIESRAVERPTALRALVWTAATGHATATWDPNTIEIIGNESHARQPIARITAIECDDPSETEHNRATL